MGNIYIPSTVKVAAVGGGGPEEVREALFCEVRGRGALVAAART